MPLHMGSESRRASPLSSSSPDDFAPFAASSPAAALTEDTATLSLSAPSAGSYELHVLSQDTRPLVEPYNALDPDDEPHADKAENLQNSASDTDENMSRAPLLVRSSPAQGTGSYGGLPVLSLSSSPSSDVDPNHVTGQRRVPYSKSKGKRKHRESEPALSHSTASFNLGRDDSIHSAPISSASRTRRGRRLARTEGSSAAMDYVEEEPIPESRFNSGSVISMPAGAPLLPQSLQTSSNSSQVEDLGEDESLSSDELHDMKPNGQPADNSPYAQVRASVAATDDITLSINTPRMWVLSILFAILGSSTNLFFSLRYPSVSITPIIALLLVHPLGLLWDQMLKRSNDPDEHFVNGALQHSDSASNGSSFASDNQSSSIRSSRMLYSKAPWRRRLRLWFAQGRWNEKEHCCVYISSNVSFGFAFATDVSHPRLYYAGLY